MGLDRPMTDGMSRKTQLAPLPAKPPGEGKQPHKMETSFRDHLWVSFSPDNSLVHVTRIEGNELEGKPVPYKLIISKLPF